MSAVKELVKAPSASEDSDSKDTGDTAGAAGGGRSSDRHTETMNKSRSGTQNEEMDFSHFREPLLDT
jgi:hypothetical protein